MRYCISLALFVVGTAVADSPVGAVPPQEALAKLMTGNERFLSGYSERPRQDPARRAEVAKGQKPFAVIVACSDSRVSPEIVFDQGLGDLFVVRIAGNTVDQRGVGSIEYAVEHLGARLVMVLGHTSCGAAAATESDSHEPGSIRYVVDPIRPSAKGSPSLMETVRRNVLYVKRDLKETPLLKKRLDRGEIEVTGAVYDLATGKVARVGN
jgi:carbonic anhydrase